MANKQTNLTNSNPKLFQIYFSDENDRQETYRFKAYDIEDVVKYIKKEWFKPEFVNELTENWQGEDCVYIEWYEGGDCQSCCQDGDDCECDLCGDTQIMYSYEILEFENPDASDFKFNTIEGTNDFVDLTVSNPKKAENWSNELAEAMQNDKEHAGDVLLRLTKEGKLPK